MCFYTVTTTYDMLQDLFELITTLIYLHVEFRTVGNGRFGCLDLWIFFGHVWSSYVKSCWWLVFRWWKMMKNIYLRSLMSKSDLAWLSSFNDPHPPTGWWFGGHQFYFPIYWVAIIIPIDELIFFRGVAQPPTSQSCLTPLTRWGPSDAEALLVVNPNDRLDAQGALLEQMEHCVLLGDSWGHGFGYGMIWNDMEWYGMIWIDIYI